MKPDNTMMSNHNHDVVHRRKNMVHLLVSICVSLCLYLRFSVESISIMSRELELLTMDTSTSTTTSIQSDDDEIVSSSNSADSLLLRRDDFVDSFDDSADQDYLLQQEQQEQQQQQDDNDDVEDDSNEQQQVQSSKHATVMGMAKGYGLRDFKKFVGSLRAVGFEGTIILVVAPIDELPKRVVDYLDSQNVTMKPLQLVDCTFAPKHLLDRKKKHGANSLDAGQTERVTCGHPYPDLKLRWGRFALLRDYLRDCSQCTGPVLITDVRDTMFQRDPFGPEAPRVTGLQLFQEDPQQKTTHFVTKGPIFKCKGRVLNETMLCSGTTIGTKETMLQYLGAMITEMRDWLKDPKCNHPGNGDDQAIHNWLYYTGKLDFMKPNIMSIPNGQGLVHTVGTFGAQAFREKRNGFATKFNIEKPTAQGMPYTSVAEEENGNWLGNDWNTIMTAEYQLTNQQTGYFINSNGEPSFIVHQYDRFGTPLERWLFRSGPCKGICERDRGC